MRKVIITRSSYLIHPNELACYANVRKCWQLPREHTLLELDDPIFLDLHTLYPPSRSRAAAIIQEAGLFAPYYRETRSLTDVVALKVSTATTWYHLVRSSRTELKWPKLVLFKNWHTGRHVQVRCHFRPKSEPDFIGFSDTVAQWESFMRHRKILRSVDRLDHNFSTWIARFEFNNSAADATIAFFMLLSLSRAQISLKSVSVSLPHPVSQLSKESEEIADQRDAS